MDIKRAFAIELKRARAAVEMTQATLAHEANVGITYLKEMELAQKQPTLTTLCKLATALGTTPQKLIGPAWETWKKENKR